MVFFILIQNLMECSVGGDPDQTLCSVVSDLGLHSLPYSYKKDTRLKWVKVALKVATPDFFKFCPCLYKA